MKSKTKKDVRPKAKWVMVHDDGPCADGKEDTILQGGRCPACGFSPDMQSTAFIFHCPTHNVKLDSNDTCPTCKVEFDTSY